VGACGQSLWRADELKAGTMSGGISIHCVDVASGRVATGLKVALHRLDPQGEPIADPLAQGEVGSTGQLQHPSLSGDAIGVGGYEAVFWVGDFYRSQGTALPQPAFLERVVYRFHISDPAQHYHLPFKFTAWGYSLFRGGA
jgi:5-hydroxyisourate hydrolase-like protein (transthyretin family)